MPTNSGLRSSPSGSLFSLRRGERLVTVGSYEGRPQRVHIAKRHTTGRYGGYETLCGFYASNVGPWGDWMRPSTAEAPTCKRCLAKAGDRG